ncbi:MAG TPA: ATP-binding protein [Flavisolibacter sp.]|nr:ATP-binding protein [Flavisolibacter sp.]
MNQELSDLILNHFLDSVLVVNEKGMILYANKAAEKLFSQPNEKITGQQFDLQVIPYEVQQLEYICNGEVLILQTLASVVSWNSQTAFLLSIRDVTGFGKATKELEKQKQQLETANNELEQYASLASHDLKEPLRKITIYADKLLKKAGTLTNAELQDQLEKIHNASIRMSMLMNGIAEFAKIKKGSDHFTSVDLNEVVNEVLSDLEIMIAETNTTLQVDELPTIQAYKIHMHQLFLNLISNAIKYSKKDIPPFISIKQSESKQRVEISITDNGIGFDSIYAEKVFLPFQRLNNGSSEGSGIGLTICKKIVEAHGGKIAVKSQPGTGTEFTLSLVKNG